MLNEVLKQFSRMDHGDKIATDRIVSSFIKLGAAQYLAAAGNYINNRQLAAVVKSRYEISKISTDSMLNDLLRYKLISEKPSASVVTLIMKAEEGSQSGFIMGLLTRESRWLNFDTETDFLPVDYDQLLMNYAAKSKGMLKDMLVWMDNRKKKNGNQYDYTITVVCNNKAFIARPQDSGDWYDMMTVNELLDKVLIDLNSRERFVQLDHWGQDLDIIYGEPAPVNELVKKYGL
jgi:hypothetical protein